MLKNISNDYLSLDEVVELINSGTESSYSAEELASEHAYNAADEAGYGIDETSIEAHLDFLAQQGARFDGPAALKLALNLKK